MNILILKNSLKNGPSRHQFFSEENTTPRAQILSHFRAKQERKKVAIWVAHNRNMGPRKSQNESRENESHKSQNELHSELHNRNKFFSVQTGFFGQTWSKHFSSVKNSRNISRNMSRAKSQHESPHSNTKKDHENPGINFS